MQGQDVRDPAPADMFRNRAVTGRQPSRVPRIAKRDGPALMERVKQARVDAGPVVNRHGSSLLPTGYAGAGRAGNPSARMISSEAAAAVVRPSRTSVSR